MDTKLYIFIIFIALTSCSNLTTSKNKIIDCNDRSYTNIDSALKCGADPLEYKSLLFALVSSDVEKYQTKGWGILKDKDIIEIAKRDYVLIIIDPKKVTLSKDLESKEFFDILKTERKEIYFVVTNRVFYPFREFTLNTDKEKIISDLGLGEGP